MKDNRAFILREDKAEEFLSKPKNKPRIVIKEVSDIEKRKQGKWLVNKDGITYCSKCESLQYGGHYCSNCGAEMESEE
jgi:methionyl-tRNA synthetase